MKTYGHGFKMRSSLPPFPAAMMLALMRMNLHEEQSGYTVTAFGAVLMPLTLKAFPYRININNFVSDLQK